MIGFTIYLNSIKFDKTATANNNIKNVCVKTLNI